MMQSFIIPLFMLLAAVLFKCYTQLEDSWVCERLQGRSASYVHPAEGDEPSNVVEETQEEEEEEAEVATVERVVVDVVDRIELDG